MSSTVELLAFAAGHYAVLLVAFAAAWSLGRRLTAGLRYRNELEAAAISTALGLGAWSTALLLVAMAGLLRPLPVLLLLAAAQYACRSSWVAAWKALRHWLDGTVPVGRILAGALVGILLVPLLSLPLYPPTDFDATMFHLPMADAIVAAGGIEFFEALRYPVFPALQEMLYASTMLFQSDVAPAVVHFGAFLLVALLLYCWGAWLTGPRAGAWAALLWLGANAAVRNATGAYVDCALALFVTAALFALHRYFRRLQIGWLLLAGALAAFAAATKYHGLYFVFVISLAGLAHAAWGRRWRQMALFSGVVVAVLLPWYGFVYYHTGNPLFPFFPAVFGMTPWAFELRYSGSVPMSEVEVGPLVLARELAVLLRVLLNKAILMLDQGLVKLIALPVEVFRTTGSFRGHPLSQLTLLGLPVAVLAMVWFRHARYLALLAGLYLLAWAGTAQELRYLIPALPILALPVAEGLDRLASLLAKAGRPWLRPVLTALVTVPLALQVYWVSSELSWQQGRPPSTPEQRERFLELRLYPYAAIRALNERHGSDYSAYGLFLENMRHFVEGEHLGDWFGPERYGIVLGKLHNRDALHRRLVATGADYLILPKLARWKTRLKSQFWLPPPHRLAPHFELDSEDRFIRVYRILSTEEIEVLR